MKNRNIAVYMRVSTANQEKDETIDNQFMELKEKIKNEGGILKSDCIYKDDGWSGAILERPALDELRADAKNKKFDTLYVYDRGRIARKFLLQEIVIEELRKLEIDLISLHDINGKTHEEILMGSVMGVFHEYERVKITERMRIGKFRKVRENKLLLGYNPKYGYDYYPRIKKGPDARNGYFAINQQQASVVHQIYEWAANGESKYSIRDLLYKNSIPPAKEKSDSWSLSVIQRLLRDTTYMGTHYYNKSESCESKKPRSIAKYRRTVKGS